MIPALVNNPLFRGITPERLFADLEEISFHTRSYKKGEILARQGDVCNRLVILTKGSVRGEMIDYSGRLIKVEDIAVLSKWKTSLLQERLPLCFCSVRRTAIRWK